VSAGCLSWSIAAVTKRRDFEKLELNEFGAELDWTGGKGELRKI